MTLSINNLFAPQAAQTADEALVSAGFTDGILVPGGTVNLSRIADVDRFIARNADWIDKWMSRDEESDV